MAFQLFTTCVGGSASAGKPLHLVVGEDGFDGDPPAAISSITQAGSLEEMRQAGAELAAAR